MHTYEGTWDGTSFHMGPIHPRPKHLVGRRMALAAATTAYKTDSPPGLLSQGPTISNCSVVDDQIVINFKTGADFLGDDAVHGPHLVAFSGLFQSKSAGAFPFLNQC